MTDYGKQKNPIAEAWLKHPEWRADFVQEIIIGNYKSLYERLEEKAVDIKVGGTDPDWECFMLNKKKTQSQQRAASALGRQKKKKK